MHRLNRYIFTTVSAGILLVLLVFLGLNFVAEIIDETRQLEGNYTFVKALQFVAFSIPANIFDLLPFVALIGCLVGLGALAGNSELVIMRAAGVSTNRIVWMAMRPAMVILLIGVLISEFIAPYTESIALSNRSQALSTRDLSINPQGIWHREGNKFMQFMVVQPGGVVYGMSIFTFDDRQRLVNQKNAVRAIYNGGKWTLEGLTETHFLEDRIVLEQKDRETADVSITPELLKVLMLDPIDLSIRGLWQYGNYLDHVGVHSSQYWLAFWKKVLQPLSALALVFVAISFIFGPLREVTMGYRIFVGVLFGIVFRTIQDILTPASLVYGFPPVFASLVPVILCAIVGIVLLRRTR